MSKGQRDTQAVPSELELARTMAQRFPTALAQAKTIVENPQSTIEPAPAASDSSGRQAVEGLQTTSARHRLGAGLDVGETLGEGGMGLVRLATQRALGRSVVVKTLRPEAAAEPSASLRLLREAWVTGQLEHPNIVPVYDLGVDDAGLPIIVLKRIEGRPWSELVGRAEQVRDRFGAEDLLEWNLRILLQLTHALELAHARGVIHRDVKPENVMIGAFGEVYLVDWGIAVSLRDDPTGRLPYVKHAKEMAGTPCYMAPEMLGGDPSRLGPRTDVYLLGATLYEILCGVPPHRGANLQAMLHDILLSEPALSDDAPPELAAICRRAMSREPEDRHGSVAELRAEIEGFLRHRESTELTTEARARHDELAALLAALPAKPADARSRLYDLFGECRFGYRQALRSWPDNTAAGEGLRAASEAMIGFELEHGSSHAAAAILAELPNAPPELVARVEKATAEQRREERRMRELAKLGNQVDPTVGWRTRTFAGALFGLLWTVVPLVAELERDCFPLTYQALYVATLVLGLLGGAFNLWARETIRKSRINRGQARLPFVVFLAQGLVLAAAQLRGVDVITALILCMGLWALGAGVFALLVDRRLAPVGIGYAVALLVSAEHPESVFLAAAASNFVAGLAIVVLWAKVGLTAEARASSPESSA